MVNDARKGSGPMIDWSSDETHLLLNPRLPGKDRESLVRLQRSVPALAAHVWIATSGTSGAYKLVALSKKALLASAEAVNLHLRATSSDVWLSVLPTFHVGGLGILARASLSGARVVSAQWDARDVVDLVAVEQVSLASLVPAQVSDLVAARLEAPSSLRAVVVGGGALRDELYREARALGGHCCRATGSQRRALRSQPRTCGTPRCICFRGSSARL